MSEPIVKLSALSAFALLDSPLSGVSASSVPSGGQEPVFREPWEAQVFALAVALSKAQLFTWPEWTAKFSEATSSIPPEEANGDVDFYHAWLDSLEDILVERGITSEDGIARYVAAWSRAFARTPHGSQVLLATSDFADAISGADGK